MLYTTKEQTLELSYKAIPAAATIGEQNAAPILPNCGLNIAITVQQPLHYRVLACYNSLYQAKRCGTYSLIKTTNSMPYKHAARTMPLWDTHKLS